MKIPNIYKLAEPRLVFGYGQKVEDPRDGLSVFGPFDRGKVEDFSVGVIGTKEGIRRMKDWLVKLNKPIYHPKPDIAKPFFPGFEEVFGIKMNLNHIPQVEVDENVLATLYKYDDSHVRVGEIVNLYVESLLEYLNVGEKIPKLWFVIIPDVVYSICRPKSTIPKEGAIHVGIADSYTRKVEGMFESEVTKKWRESYSYENHFHNQLKIKLLKHRILTQIIKEGTIAYEEYNLTKSALESKKNQQTAVVWNLATTIYYKVGGLPWKLGDIRKDVCYIGLTFKQDLTHSDVRYACCAAQMFLDSGDGTVFRGRVGPYYNPKNKEYHLSKDAAKELLSKVVQAFKKDNDNRIPKEIFIHGKTYFNDDEWAGFIEAVGEDVTLNGIRIRSDFDFKLFRSEKYPILRGSAYYKSDKSAYLWTKGFIPRIQSILGLETPNPLSIQIIRGNSDINTVCKDILALTKLNYNACLYCDGNPVTLKFADTIGEILTAGPNENLEILPFMYYI